jgi:surface protein
MKFFNNFFLALCLVLFALASSVDAAVEAITQANFQTACTAWVSNSVTATATYGDIAGWNTGAVTDMTNAFRDAASFNDDISLWDTSAVTTMYQVSNERIICY